MPKAKSQIGRLKQALNNWLDANNGLLRGEAKLYSKGEWKGRGEEIGRNSDLTLIIEGSPLYNLLNYADPSSKFKDEVESQLTEMAHLFGYYWELGYAWSIHFYPE